MLLVDLCQAGFMHLTLLPQSILRPVGDVILESMNVALQHTQRVSCMHQAVHLLARLGVDIWVNAGEPYGTIQNEDCGCIRCGCMNLSGQMAACSTDRVCLLSA